VNSQLKIGLLPLYLKLYDEIMPDLRRAFDPFLDEIGKGFEKRGIRVLKARITRTSGECRRTLSMFRRQGAQAVVTVHLAYSPSLESADALGETGLPVVMLDTTMDLSFGTAVKPDRIMYNHGIHGVMDLASVLRRRGHPYAVVAGHSRSDPHVLDRAAGFVRAAAAAGYLRRTKALLIGRPFRGMGDFAVSDSVLRQFGITVSRASVSDVEKAAASVETADVRREVAADRRRFECEIGAEDHERSVRVGLGVRSLIRERQCDAFSFNFLSFDRSSGPACTVPFLEASKAMERGVGYAGEGDVLTAALVGALQRAFGRTTFTEIFCPDWRGNSLFLSHMGEINPRVSAAKPVIVLKEEYRFSGALPPAIVVCAAAPGPAVFVNLAPCPKGEMTLIVAPVTVLQDARDPSMRRSVRTWIRPASGSVAAFLEAYSNAGGTHHSALVLGGSAESLAAMGRFAGVNVVVID